MVIYCFVSLSFLAIMPIMDHFLRFRRLFSFVCVLMLSLSTVVAFGAEEDRYRPTFTPPRESESALVTRAWFGRLADFTIVYSQPSRLAPIVRNVGDGYLFSSIMAHVEAEGEEWYLINPNEYVLAADVKVAKPSEFSGFEVNRTPTTPFGWAVTNARPSAYPDGEGDLRFSRLNRYDLVYIYAVQEGADNTLWYYIGSGRWVKQYDLSIVQLRPRPEGVPKDAYWVDVDLFEQTMAAYQGDKLVYTTLISSGLPQWATNEGLFKVWLRLKYNKMSGAEGKPDYYFVEDVPYILFFDNDISFHGTYWHDAFGYKQSHGCVNLSLRDSEWLYSWSEDEEELWVNVHTSDPHTILETSINLPPAEIGRAPVYLR